jgi:hypothetical protein
LGGNNENLFSLKALLINDSLVFYNPTNTDNVIGSGSGVRSILKDLGPNNSHMDITTTLYLNDTHFIFNDISTTQMLKTDAMNNISTTPFGELLNFTVNIWIYIQKSNDKTEEQTLLVIGDVIPYNKSINLSNKKTADSSFKLSLKHYPSNMTLNYVFEKSRWYNIVYVKRIRDYFFYVDGVFVSVIRDIFPIHLPDNSAISVGRDHSRLSYNPLHSARVGIVSVYERSLSPVEINALYNDYKIHYQNIPLLNALASFNLTKPETVSRVEIQDLSGNGNYFGVSRTADIEYDGETSVIFNSLGKHLVRHMNICYREILILI